MKRVLSLLIALTLILGLTLPAMAADTKPCPTADSAGLKFSQEGKFKILQLSDTQEFLISSTIAQEFIYDLVKAEKPDVIILTGDNISGSGAKVFPKAIAMQLIKMSVNNLMKVFDRIYKEFGIPVTMVYGNHDNEAGKDKVSRAEQFAIYAEHECFIGYYIDEADKGTSDVDGQHYGTHNLIVKDAAGTAPIFNLWMFDSGSNDTRGGYSGVQKPQIDWFNKTNAALGKLPSLAFQHIIVPEVYDFLTPEAKKSDTTYEHVFYNPDGSNEVMKYVSTTLPAGTKGNLHEGPCPGNYNYGQYEALNTAGNVMALFVGHDHKNTYELLRDNTDLVNTACASFGSYGDIETRGGRIIELDAKDLTQYTTRTVRYQGYYGDNAIREIRLKMFQELSTFASVIDVILFKPLLWIIGWFN